MASEAPAAGSDVGERRGSSAWDSAFYADDKNYMRSWEPPPFAPEAWVEFWTLQEKASLHYLKLNASDPFFADAVATFSFRKLGEEPVPTITGAMPFLQTIPGIGSAFCAAWETRHAVVKRGCLFYFKDDAADALPLGCILLSGATISTHPPHKDADGTKTPCIKLVSPMPRKPGRTGRGEFILGEDSRAQLESHCKR